jgi:hypothetical protein
MSMSRFRPAEIVIILAAAATLTGLLLAVVVN